MNGPCDPVPSSSSTYLHVDLGPVTQLSLVALLLISALHKTCPNSGGVLGAARELDWHSRSLFEVHRFEQIDDRFWLLLYRFEAED
jgi:hypothetical protein